MPNDYIARLSFDKPDKVYKVGQDITVFLNLTNAGAVLWSSTVNVSIPDLAFEDSKLVALGPNETEEIRYDLNIGKVTAGKHDVIVTIEMDNSTINDCFFIPESNLVLSIGRTSYNAGENVSINISNTGGVDTTFINCSIKFSNKRGFVIYENETQGDISAGENATISFEIPDQAVKGDYQLIASCKDNKTGKLSKLSKSCKVDGLKAVLTSVTDKKAYLSDENVSILTNITNLDGAIVNGTLNLKIVRTYTPNSTMQALARAAAKLSATHNSSHNSSIVQSASHPPANFSPGLNPYNFFATARATSLPANLTPSPEPSPEDEFKPSAAKLSSREIGSEMVWKDETRILNEDLIVNSTGNLTLINTTVIMNCSSNGQYHIEIQNGGEMHIFDSNITAKNTNYNYYFQVKTGSIFEMNNSKLQECGYTGGTNGDKAGLWINTDNTIIKNNVLTNNYWGIILRGSSNSSIANNTVSSNNWTGIFLDSSSGNTIAHNTVSSNNDGIHLHASSGNTIANNTVSSNNHGITLIASSSNTIAHNTVSSNRLGIYLICSSSSNTIANNTVSSNNDYGIFLGSSIGNTIAHNTISQNSGRGIYISHHSGSNTIAHNTVSSNNWDGICLDSSSGNTIAHNTVSSNNVDGIFLGFSSGNTIANNTVSSNNWTGIDLFFSSGNLIYNNYFNNTNNARDDGNNMWSITKIPGTNIVGGPWLGGNYWNDYEGEDWDGDELGDTLLPYNCNGRIQEGGDYLPLVMPSGPQKEVLWEKNITINLAEDETKNIIYEVPASVFKDVTGKQELITVLYSNTTQIINISDSFFYITPKNTSLTLETDKRVYKPNETVLIYGEVKNNAVLTDDYNLSIKKDEVEIFSDAFTLDPGESHGFTTSTSSNASFTLEGTVDGVTVADLVSVETASINVSIIAPDIVGLADFDIGVLIENTGKIYADLNVSINSTWNITVPEGESRLLETTKNITKNTTLNVIISGDVNKTIQKEIIFGENSKINITPESTYLEGEVEIPFTINNTGVLDSKFNATFSISSPEQQNITKHFFVPKGGNITDSVSFNLTKGAHLLRYVSPFEAVKVMINVLSPPEFNVTSILPAELNFTTGENVTFVFKVENIGGSEGEAALTLEMPDFEDTNRTWIRAGAEENISFNFSIPDDLEEKSYKGIYELDGKRDEFTYFVQGANISVNASLDKNMYAEGDTAVFTLEIENECKLDLNLYSRVKFNEYDSVQNFTLSGSGTKTLTFNVPINFTGDNKMLYTVYRDSGRALYINSIYVYEKKPDVPLRLYTDKDVYNMGENVTIHIVDVTRTDVLNLTASKFTYNNTISGPTTLEFTLPELRSGTYYIDYRFGNFSSAHPFDVIGYYARILEAGLDKENYTSGNTLGLWINIDANRNVSGLLKIWIYGPEDELLDEFEMNVTLMEGENKIEISRTLSTNISGIHAIVYGFYADLSGHSLTSLVSGAEYFDAEAGLENPVADAGGPYTGVVGSPIAFDGTGSYDPDGTIVSYEWDLDNDGEFDDATGATPSKTWDTAYSGIINLRVTDNDGATDIDSTTLIVEEAEDTTPPAIESVTLDAYTTIPDATIHVTVEATDNVGVTLVTANGINLVETGSVWVGDITAPSITGDYTLTIRAEDATGNFASSIAYYSVVIPEGGLGVAIIPKISSATAGSSLDLTVKIVSTENFDDVLHVYLTTEGIPPGYKADLSWFSWTEKNDVPIPAGGQKTIELSVDIPSGVSGDKGFGVKVDSTKWSSHAQDYGVIQIS